MTRYPLNRMFPLALLALALPAAAEPGSRLAAALDARSTVQLHDSTHPRAQARYDTGRLDGTTEIHGSLHLALSAAQEADLDGLLRAQQDPASPHYHAWLTPAQYGARFGLSAADLARVEAWLRGQGLSVESVESGGNHIHFRGSAGRVEAAFQTELHRYEIGGERHFANATELSVPAALSGMVLGVRGLDDFRPRPHLRQAPAFTSSISGNNYLSPGDIATIYDIKSLYDAGITGSGRKIAVAGQTQVNLSDIQAFRTAAGLPANDPQMVQVPNSGTASLKNGSDDMNESDIDLEWTGGIARDATIIFVFVGTNQNVFDAMGYAITADLAPVVSISYGNCEANNAGEIPTAESWLKQANAQGQTVVASSGDSGAADCDAAGSATASGGLAVDYPASSPEVTGAGGTEFNENGSSAYWTPKGSTDVISSAQSYIPEVAWNDTGKSDGSGGTIGLSASGGGASAKFTRPSWQANTGSFSADARYVPDLSVAAAPSHDGYLYCTTNSGGEGTCAKGFRANDAQTTLTVAGGTSFSAPVVAGMLALVGQKAGLSGLGNANVRLYQLAGSTAFHDIVSGDNRVPTTSGSLIGYLTATGYDPVTGLGTVDTANLADAWAVAGGSSSSSGGSSSSSSSSGSGSNSGGGGKGGGAWTPLSLALLGALRLLKRRR